MKVSLGTSLSIEPDIVIVRMDYRGASIETAQAVLNDGLGAQRDMWVAIWGNTAIDGDLENDRVLVHECASS